MNDVEEIILGEIKDLKNKVDSLIKFKWTIVGAVMATSTIVSGVVCFIFELKK